MRSAPSTSSIRSPSHTCHGQISSEEGLKTHESKIAVNRHPAGKCLTIIVCTSPISSIVHLPHISTQTSKLAKLTIIIHDMSSRLEIQWINNLIVTIIFVPVQILRLSTVSRAATPRQPPDHTTTRIKAGVLDTMQEREDTLVEEERIIRLGIGHKPLHGVDHIGSRRHLTGVPGVIREQDDIF